MYAPQPKVAQGSCRDQRVRPSVAVMAKTWYLREGVILSGVVLRILQLSNSWATYVMMTQRSKPKAAASPPRVIFNCFCCLRTLPSSSSAMAPVGDADHCRDKARRELLALLEGVSTPVA